MVVLKIVQARGLKREKSAVDEDDVLAETSDSEVECVGGASQDEVGKQKF